MSPPDLGLLFSAIASPVASDGSLGEEAARALAERHVDVGVEGIYCGGSSGEGLLLDLDERRRMLAAVLDGVAGRIPVVAHVGAMSTRDSVALAQHAEAGGAVAISMIPPIYYRYSHADVVGHYRTVMDAVGLPMILYNIPQFTGQEFDSGHELLSDPRVIGIKHTAHSMYELERFSRHHPHLQLINGFDEAYLPSLMAGAAGSIGTTVSMQIDTFKAVRALAGAGRLVEARAFQSRINDVIETLVRISVFPAAKRLEQELSGLKLGPCRQPFQPVPDDAVAEIRGLAETVERNNSEARDLLASLG